MQYFILNQPALLYSEFYLSITEFSFILINSVYGNYVKLKKILILLWVVWS